MRCHSMMYSLEGPEKREIQNGSDNHVKKWLKEEADTLGIHHNQREVGKTQNTRAAAPSVEGEHVHHHVHEHIQLIIQKETVQPHVVHRTKPIHEVHQHEPEHHGASILPSVTLEESERQGGSVHGSSGERSDAFAGEPGRLDRGHIDGAGVRGTTSLTHPDGESGVGYHAPSTRRTTRGGTPEMYGPSADARGINENDHEYGLSSEGTHHHGADSLGYTTSPRSGTRGKSSVPRGSLEMRRTSESTPGATHTTTSPTQHKPTFIEKLNPKKDADGDGKAGTMT
ncbi:hypothetical protein INS49_004967 [Diaporthe citri]|uniref:uncharacterized protein n=1 Tax=Diaporthe citri TaxID=83186 RepID=UPI001C8093BD|nr:uncharacterized protein INS49_004967 [Diaporthe citri]KAG6353996.1 hypothetical protein INS49_004967 [Diaporthe citri]